VTSNYRFDPTHGMEEWPGGIDELGVHSHGRINIASP